MYLGPDGVSGSGSDTVGTFDIVGSRNEDAKAVGRLTDKNGKETWEYRFTKKYHGKHTVLYYGNLNGAELSGRWEINSDKQSRSDIPEKNKGEFRLTCDRW